MDPVQRYMELEKQMKKGHMRYEVGKYNENPSGVNSMQEINLIVDNSNE